MFHSNPLDNVFDAERLIGRNMDKADLMTDMKHTSSSWPYGVIDKGGKPSISVDFKREKRGFVSFIWSITAAITLFYFYYRQTPEEISAMVLVKMEKTAGAYSGDYRRHRRHRSSMVSVCLS